VNDDRDEPRPYPATVLALALACLLPLVWPGDVSFINDEPLLIASALAANAAHTLAPMGLLGTFGFTYGPLATWLYQFLVLITHDLVTMVVIHGLLMMVTTAVALWWVARSLRLWPWFAVVPLLSPYTWFYARVLWDNTLLIPLSALALAGYAAHLSRHSAAGLRVSLVALLLLPLVHLMALALVIPLALHLVLTGWRSLWARRISAGIIVAVVVIVAWPYWTYLLTSHAPPSSPGGIDGWMFPLLGGRLLSARHLTYFFGAAPVSGAVVAVAAQVSWLAYALVWAGIGVAAWYIVTALRSRRWTPRAHMAVVLLGALVCQIAIDGMSGKFQHPHYENGTWMVFVLLAWLTLDACASARPTRWAAITVSGALAAALTLPTVVIAIRLHQSGGTRETYGATLANQQQIARDLEAYAPEVPVIPEVALIQRYPHALAAVRQLTPRGERSRRAGSIVIRYANRRPESGVIMLEERQ
jgi:hypothetical protein